MVTNTQHSISPFRYSPTLAFVLLGAMLGACGGDDSGASTPVGPTGDVTLTVSGYRNDEGQRFDGDESPVTLSCGGSIDILFGPTSGGTLKNWLLRPPGTCESYKQCGYLTVTLTPKGTGTPLELSAATIAVEVSPAPGSYELQAQLFTGDGEPFLQDEQTVTARVSAVEFLASDGCAPTGAGGSSGSGSGGTSTSDAGGAAGAAGAAGAPDGGQAGMPS